MTLDRRRFLVAAGGVGAAAAASPALGRERPSGLEVPDDGWSLWIDRAASWAEDEIHLPSQVELADLPVNPPTGGWDALGASDAIQVVLPTTVEQHFWGRFGSRPYGPDEYRYAETDDVPLNGAYKGVSWWSRSLDIPAEAQGRRVLLNLRGARLRAEVFLNRRLVGYSIMSELPFSCDLTQAMQPGQANRLDIRITNPGGRFDWRDSTTMTWGSVRLFASHGFGGLDRGMTLSLHPQTGRISDAWVLNTPDPRHVTGHVEVLRTAGSVISDPHRRCEATLIDDRTGSPVAAEIRLDDADQANGLISIRFAVSAPAARLWSLEEPVLYRLRFRWTEPNGQIDEREVRFGFRWFGVDGVGEDAMLRLNGRRIRLYSAISWGYWGYNGLWPTRSLARREVEAAHALGLNALHFHRNVGKPEVFEAMDEMGLLRVMEPGGGRHAIARNPGGEEGLSKADAFSRRFMFEKCQAMARAFRSHPSLAHYTLQNEIGADLSNTDVQWVLKAIHDLDPSRAVILNDGFVKRGAAQAMYLPYSDHYYRSDVDAWGGWWVEHQGAGDQWYDRFYAGKDDYIHREVGKPWIVEFGEMQGCAVADNHVKLVADIMANGGKSYDLDDHVAIIAETGTYLDRWGFRDAFPTTESLFLSVGRKAYEAWRNYMENIRIGDEVDIAAISGWETTAIENHSGIVDNLRYVKADPTVLSQSLRPVMAIAKPRRLSYGVGDVVDVDVYLLNDTADAATGEVRAGLVSPDGKKRELGVWPVPAQSADVFRYLVAEHVRSAPFEQPGLHTLRVEIGGVVSDRELWVVDDRMRHVDRSRRRYALFGVAQSLRSRLTGLTDARFEDFAPGIRYDGIIASGLKADEIARRQVGEETGLEAQPTPGTAPPVVLGELSAEVLAAVASGAPLLAVVQEDGLADGVAKQLADTGLFEYAGQVGGLRAPWMGNWNYVRRHRTFDGIPVDCGLSVLHQVEGQPSNGLLIEGEGIEVIAAYSRDHDRKNGAASFTVEKTGMRVLVHRLPDMVRPLQDRWLLNALDWLAE